MALRTDKGCGTPQNATLKNIHEGLVQLFAPIVYFEPEEQFFPVDLPSTIMHSSLWRTDPKAKPPSTQRERNVGAIDPVNHLPGTTKHHYTTVAGTGKLVKVVEGQATFTMPAPLLDDVLRKYTDGTIPAELTIYGTVCKASDVPNNHFFKNGKARDKDVVHALAEGLIVSYYMYFPYRVSPDFESEGDWSGISLLLNEVPGQLSDLNDPEKVKSFQPVVACYYRKTIDGAPPSPHFVAGTQGMRRWQNVKKVKHQPLNLDTHPIVYVSRGRHNCYYDPVTSNIPLSPPWESQFKADKIESGSYTPGPTSNTLVGGGVEDIPLWAYVLFPPLAALVACGTGCEYPSHFDSSGLPSGFQDGEDTAKGGGYDALPKSAGSSYPKKPAGQVPPPSRQINLQVKYVDLDDPVTAALWGYPGAWGGATLEKAIPAWDPKNPWIWGHYQGARRPALAAWFLWNLFIDSTFGCAGYPPLTPTP